REVVQSPAADPEWSQSLANCAYYRGLVQQLRSDHSGALLDFSNYLGLVQAQVERIPQNSRRQFELAVAHSRVGEALFKLKQFEAALPPFDAYEEFARNLTQIDPRNVAWRALHGQSLAWKGYLAKARNPADALARDYLVAALTIQSN